MFAVSSCSSGIEGCKKVKDVPRGVCLEHLCGGGKLIHFFYVQRDNSLILKNFA